MTLTLMSCGPRGEQTTVEVGGRSLALVTALRQTCDDTGACATSRMVLIGGNRFTVACDERGQVDLGGLLYGIGTREEPIDEVRTVPNRDPREVLLVHQRADHHPCGEPGWHPARPSLAQG